MTSHITTHVLDTARGIPAAGISVSLAALADGSVIGSGVTNQDGRITELGPDVLPGGDYRLTFDVADYLAADGGGRTGFFRTVTIDFRTEDGARHYHVPLLLSPFGYTTYRGS